MANKTSIEWTDYNWNSLRGCSRVSEGCRNCYAEGIAARFSGYAKGKRLPYFGLAEMVNGKPRWTGEISFHEGILLRALRWKKPRRVFVNSMSDLFHEKVKDEWLDKAFAVMALTPQHTYQILTKRPERMLEYMTANPKGEFPKSVEPRPMISYQLGMLSDVTKPRKGPVSLVESCDANNRMCNGGWPLPNVWLGVSVEDQKTADERIPLLLQTPAAVRWISAEPLLGRVDFTRLTYQIGPASHIHNLNAFHKVDSLNKGYPWPGIDWIVVGGESGPNARPFDIAWARSIIQQCKAAGVPVFVKQLGTNARSSANSDGGGAQLDLRNRKGGDINEWPMDLRIREYPDQPPATAGGTDRAVAA